MSRIKAVIHSLHQKSKTSSWAFAVAQLFAAHGLFRKMSDKQYLSMMYRFFYNGKKKLNLENPQTLTEKIQWLKLYDRRPIYTSMVDKYEVKKIIAERVGTEHVIPALGIYDKFEEIDFDKLPEQFVLKCTHDSGGIYFCRDRAKFNKEDAKVFFEKRLARSSYDQSREWAYKNVRPRIVAEPYMEGLGNSDSVEYKVSCFDGKVEFLTVCRGIAHISFDGWTNDFYDREFRFLPFRTKHHNNSGIDHQKPEQLQEMIEFCEKVAEGIPYLRVDFYLLKGKIYFGEATFYTWGGFMHFTPPEWDKKLGDLVHLPEKTV